MKTRLKCILVIDDDEPTNFFTRMILEEGNYAEHIKIVQSGQEALTYLAKCESPGYGKELHPSPDLVFLDINMPAMNGWEFLEEYKKMTLKNRIIMVMLTTSLFPEDKQKAEDTPEISGFENKPITVEKVSAVIDKYFVNAHAK